MTTATARSHSSMRAAISSGVPTSISSATWLNRWRVATRACGATTETSQPSALHHRDDRHGIVAACRTRTRAPAAGSLRRTRRRCPRSELYVRIVDSPLAIAALARRSWRSRRMSSIASDSARSRITPHALTDLDRRRRASGSTVTTAPRFCVRRQRSATSSGSMRPGVLPRSSMTSTDTVAAQAERRANVVVIGVLGLGRVVRHDDRLAVPRPPPRLARDVALEATAAHRRRRSSGTA